MNAREAFKKAYPTLEGELCLGENNPDFRGLEDLNARHAFAKFKAGWEAALHAKSEVQPAPDGRETSRQDEKEDRGEPAVLPSEPVAWLWTGRNGNVQAFVTKPPPSMLADPQCQPLYLAPIKGDPAEKSAGPSSGQGWGGNGPGRNGGPGGGEEKKCPT